MARVDEDVVESFREYTKETKGKIRGEMGRLVENALIEYMDNDRYTRVEKQLDEIEALLRKQGGTHTQSSESSKTMKRLEAIAERLHDRDVDHVPGDEVVEAIEEIAGADERTVRKYRRLLKKRGLLYKHPVSNNWFTEPRHIYGGINYRRNDREILNQYPSEFREQYQEWRAEQEQEDAED